MRISRRIRTETNDGITSGQHSVLYALSTGAYSTLQALAEREHVQPPAMTRMIAALVERGLVQRVTNSEDRRRVAVSLTPEGLAVLRGNRRQRNQWLTTRLAALPEESRRLLAAAAPVLTEISDASDGVAAAARSSSHRSAARD